MPYGPRPHEDVRYFVRQIIHFLETQDVKMVIVACNSATAAGLHYYQAEFSIPIIGVIEPGVRAALRHTKNKRVGVIGTSGTIASGAYEQLIEDIDPQVTVIARACPLFVLIVENGLIDAPEAISVAEEYLAPLRQAQIDTLILGCTHYPLMADVIAKVMGPKVKLISSAEETARESRVLLQKLNLSKPSNRPARRHRFFVSDSPNFFNNTGGKLLSMPINSYQVILS